MKHRKTIRLLLAATSIVITLAAKTSATQGGAGVSTCEVVTVEKFTIEDNAATEEFPSGQEELLYKQTVSRLRRAKLFLHVEEGSEGTAPGGRCGLAGMVVKYDKGNRAARWMVGFGAGATKVKVRFVMRAADSTELFRADREGKFYGTIGFVGGSKEHADTEAAGDVVDGLIKEIEKRLPSAKR